RGGRRHTARRTHGSVRHGEIRGHHADPPRGSGDRGPLRRWRACTGGDGAGNRCRHRIHPDRTAPLDRPGIYRAGSARGFPAAFLSAVGLALRLQTRRVQSALFRTSALDSGPVILDHPRGAWYRPNGPDAALAGLELTAEVSAVDDAGEGVDQWFVELCRDRL